MLRILISAVLVVFAVSSVPALAMDGAQCRQRCQAIDRQIEDLQDQMEVITQSGNISQQIEALRQEQSRCFEQCDALDAAQDAFRRCIAGAQGDETLIEYCREEYRDARPDFSN